MRILFDLIATQPVSGNRFHGASEYAAAVFRRLADRIYGGESGSAGGAAGPGSGTAERAFTGAAAGAGEEESAAGNAWEKVNGLVCAARGSEQLERTVRETIEDHGIDLIHVDGPADLPAAAVNEGADTVYSALPYDFGSLDFGNTRLVCTIHGLRPLETPTDRYEIRYAGNVRDVLKYLAKTIAPGAYRGLRSRSFRDIFRCSSRLSVIVPSEHTRRSLQRHVPEAAEAGVRVLPSPRMTPPRPADPSVLGELGVESGRFFLLTGANRWVKNSFRAVRALDRLFSRERSIGAGALVLGARSRRVFGRLQNPERFVFHGYVERDVLELLYSAALCFVYPTLNEGFGYPPIEAMKFGTPVICSNATSVPEVCGGGALYFDPASIEDISRRAAEVALDSEIRSGVSSAGLDRASEVMAEQEKSLDGIVSSILGEQSPVEE